MGVQPAPRVDTIVALATPAGVGALAIVRLSGPGAFEVLADLAASGELPEPRRATLVELVDDTGAALDRAVVTTFPSPSSYTGEDVVEISIHGGWLGPEQLIDACVERGARRAEPGEFTRRAYLNGKVDLVQAEAIADLIEARSPVERRVALEQADRGLSDRLGALRVRIVRLEALVAHHVDFPDEDDPPVPIEDVARAADEVRDSLDALVRTAPEGELLREGALSVLAGAPNAGKSSLFNALLGQDRTIVTEVPGTTRDAVEAVVSLGGFPFRLVDTAGLHDTEDGVEQKGIQIARDYAARADVVLHCIDVALEGPGANGRPGAGALFPGRDTVVRRRDDDPERGSPPEDQPEGGSPPGDQHDEGRPAEDPAEEGRPPQERAEESRPPGAAPPARRVVVFTKADQGALSEERARALSGGAPFARVSALTGEGLETLRTLLVETVFAEASRASGEGAPIVTRRRQARRLGEARREVDAFSRALREGVPVEVAATHLRSAETALDELLGVISTDEVLGEVFHSFCIGK